MTDAEGSHSKSASNISVTLFRLILFVPFAIEAKDPTDPRLATGEDLAHAISRKITAAGSKWLEQPNLTGHLRTAADREDLRLGAYEEFVYFQPYVQRFLYGAPGGRSGEAPGDNSNNSSCGRVRPIRLFYRDDIAFLNLQLAGPSEPARRLRLEVDRLNTYVFDTGHLILATELSFDFIKAAAAGGAPSLSLAEAMAVASQARRVFPPFLLREEEKKAGRLAAVPSDFKWVAAPGGGDADGEPLPSGDEDYYVKHVEASLATPLRPAWRALLAPMPIEGYDDGADVRLSQCGDDRAPSMLCLGVEEPAAIATEDWYRLCFGDKPGVPPSFPVAERFARGFEEAHCYDRYWQPGHKRYTTRYLCSGSSYVMVGRCAPGPRHPDSKPSADPRPHDDFRDTLQTHFRRHYFQLALISHYHRAALVSLSERLAGAVQAGASFRRLAHVIQRDVLRFTNRYWFTEVSAQPQANDLFALWQRHLRTRELYDQLARELAATTAALDAEEDAQIAQDTRRLAVWGFPGVMLAVLTGFFGMNVFGSDAGQVLLNTDTIVLGILAIAGAYLLLKSICDGLIGGGAPAARGHGHGWRCTLRCLGAGLALIGFAAVLLLAGR